MSVIRVHKNKNFTIMSNVHLQDKNLSLKAKGLLSVMLSLPDDWNYSIAGLCAICKENETAVKSALNELKLNRYVIVSKKFPNETNNGRLKYEYEVYEEPQLEGKQNIEKQDIENQGIEFQQTENQGQLNTKISIIEKFNSTFSKPKEKDMKGKQSFKERKEQLDKMIERAVKISNEKLNIGKIQSQNVAYCIQYFVDRYYELTGNLHPILRDETLKIIIERFTKKYKDDWGHIMLSLASDIDGNEEYKEVIDHYFATEFGKMTNYNLPHFASENILKNLMYHVRNYI